MSLPDLPPEILCEILGLLEPVTLLKCSTVCRTWHEAITSSPDLQYTIELWADGLVPERNGSLTARERLDTLHERRRAWRTLTWRSQTVIEIAGLGICRAYELVAGVLAVQEWGPNFCTISLPKLAADPHTPVSTQVLPGEISWESYIDFGMDPTQDLIAILFFSGAHTRTLSFRTVSGLLPHPMAQEPAINLPRVAAIFPESVTIQIANDVIAVSFFNPARLFILKWRDGTLLVDMHPPNQSAFQFMSPRAFLLASLADLGSIEIHTMNEDRSVTHVARLGLPTVAANWSVTSIAVHSAPFCGRSMQQRLFSNANTRRIYSFHVEYSDEAFPTRLFYARLFVHHRTLVAYISQYSRENRMSAIDLGWEVWGPEETRLIPGNDRRWYRHVHGERAILPSRRSSRIHLLDFGPFRNTALHLPGNEQNLGPTTIDVEEDSPFDSIVTTSLPVRSTLREIPNGQSFDQFLIEQDCMVGVDHEESRKMTVFIF